MNKEFNGLLGEAKETVWADAREIMYKRLTASNEIIQPPAEVFCDEDKKLWVEKYRPLKYIDLLSDESTNRGLLQWLKLWDKCVFGRDNRKIKETHTIPAQLNSFNKRTGRFEQNGGWRRKTKSSLNTDLDETGRPMQKIALLCGAPGLGKTTLAHTIARHAGYVVREVNASDDRSPEAFRLALENNTQMKALLNKDNRPNCIILGKYSHESLNINKTLNRSKFQTKLMVLRYSQLNFYSDLFLVICHKGKVRTKVVKIRK